MIPASEEEEASGPCSVSAFLHSTLLLHISCCRALPALLLEVFRLPSAFSCEAPCRRHGAYATSQELAFESAFIAGKSLFDRLLTISRCFVTLFGLSQWVHVLLGFRLVATFFVSRCGVKPCPSTSRSPLCVMGQHPLRKKLPASTCPHSGVMGITFQQETIYHLLLIFLLFPEHCLQSRK